MESHFQNGTLKGRRSGRVAKLIVWKRKRRCNDRASRGRKKGGWGGNKKAKYVTIEQVELLEVRRQELISGLGKLLCLEIISLEMDLKLPVVAQLYQTYGL